jgi:hypothetical protein
MKKLLLLSLVLCIGVIAYGQNAPALSKDLLNKTAEATFIKGTDDATNFENPVNMLRSAGAYGPLESQLGITWYDLFSNKFIGDRFYRWDDGTMAAVWIYGIEATAFPDRGTGYNYFDGSSWGPEPTMRLETVKTGWPNIHAWGSDGEIGVSHNGVTSLEIFNRETKGSGAWTQTNFLGPAGIENDLTWPRIITSGENNEVIHMVVNTYVEYQGQPTALLYSRSEDGGATWDPHNVVMEGTGPNDYFEIAADEYTMAARGNTVCVLLGSAWHDLFYMRSDDNGETWDKVIVWEHPYPFFDWNTTIADTTFAVDNSAHLTIDYDGHVHVVFGITRVAHWEVGTTYNYYPYVDGVGYWNDMMDPFSNELNALAPPQYGYPDTELIEDYNYIGYMQDVDGDGVITLADEIVSYRQLGPSTMPSITVDEFGYRYVVFSSTTETYVNEPYNYKHLWARGYDNATGSEQWGDFMDLTESIVHIFDECVHPILASNTDDHIHYIYQVDITPGLALDDDHAYQENRWLYGMLPKTELTPSWTGVGVEEVAAIDNSKVSQNYPNPFSGTTNVTVQLEKASELSLVVTSMTGQKVIEINKGQVPAQTHTFTIDASSLRSGIYFYTVTAGESQVTRKMIVE